MPLLTAANERNGYQKGKQTILTLKNGARYSGILSGVSTGSSDLGCLLKWVRQVRAATGSQEEEASQGGYKGSGPDKAMVFQPQDVAEIFAEGVTLGDPETAKHAPNGLFLVTFHPNCG